jgi:formate dehydrogenase major subunit
MSGGKVTLTIDGIDIEALPGETIWSAATRNGIRIPHLCHNPEPGYRADGNCRACVVEVDGERTLAASCIRNVEPDMRVATASTRARASQRMIFEMLMADQPERGRSHDPDSRLWRWADELGLASSRLPCGQTGDRDDSHPAMSVFRDACIQCTLCVRACREVQVNDVIGMAHRGYRSRIVFDCDDPMGESTCVGCGECVEACPTGALVESALVDRDGVASAMQLEETHSVCPYCGVGCQLTFLTRDDCIVAAKGRNGPANRNRLCIKGRFGLDYVHHPDRLLRPLLRRADAPKDEAGDIDPANPLTHFREASWDEVLEAAAAGFRDIRARSGPRALAGFGSAKGSNEEAYLFQKLVRTGFGSNNVDHCTRLCHASSVAALLEGIGSGAVTAPFTAVEQADVIVVIGSNPTENHPVAATFFKQAAARGAKLIVMDPRGTALGRHATHMLKFRPGTDVAMLNAMLHVIVTEDLWDEDYVERNTENFENLRTHVTRFSPEAMAAVCGVDSGTLREVARLYANAGAAIIFWGMGVSQHVHGTDNVRCLIALAAITGQIGRPGTGLHPLRGQNNVQGASDAGLIPMMYPDYQPVDQAEAHERFEKAWDTRLDSQSGLTVVEIMHAIHAGEIRGMYIMGENPAMSDPNLSHARAALARLDHLVVQDLYLTETARYADVVLPACAWPEKTGTVTNTNRQVQMGRPALKPPGDAKPDWWILCEMANRLGLDWRYRAPRDVFEEMAALMPSLANIGWDRLAQQDSVTYPCDDANHAGQDIVFGDGFPRPGGRIRLVPATPSPPDELPDSEFPLVLCTGRQLEHWHTGVMTRRAQVLDQREPEAVAFLCADELEQIGTAPGDLVRIATRRGMIEIAVRCDNSVPPGMVFVPFCYAEAAANLLTNPALDPDGRIPEFKFCAARVSAVSTEAGAGARQ